MPDVRKRSNRAIPAQYSAWQLLRRGVAKSAWPAIFTSTDLAPSYDVVIIGGGVHGLATAYYLATHHGVKSIAVLERSYIGSGGSGRNTSIVRANYLTPEGSAFYDRSLTLYEGLSTELNFNLMLEKRGHMTLAHSDASLRTMRWRAEVNKLQNIDSEVIGPEEIKELAPAIDVSSATRHPILGALWHPPGGTVRHDAVVWGYARAAIAQGVHIHQGTELTGIDVDKGKVTGVTTNRGRVSTPVVVNCTAGWSSLIARMAGIELPIHTFPLQAAVTEPVSFFLTPVIVSGSLHVYVSQTARGELVFGAAVDPYPSYSTRGSLEFIEGLAANVLQLMPALTQLRVLRQWAGLCDMTPDYSPLIGPTSVNGFYINGGWGTYGFKAAPAAGEALAELIASGRFPDRIAAFHPDRFRTGSLVGEKGAAAVGH